eukprot:jgi/Botrbrau1/16407/Bobra.0142s0007.1
MPFGQLVIGPPGSGKTTFCNGMHQFLTLLGRKAVVINLDPANEFLPYECSVDIADLVSLDEVMKNMGLGPNGGLIYCMEYLKKNMDWLTSKLGPYEREQAFFIFDFPGQAELFCLDNALQRIVEVFTKEWHYSLVAVQLVDAHLCTDAGKYLSAVLLSLQTMLHLELPQVNILSKVDLLQHYGTLAFDLDFYLQVQDLSYLADLAKEQGLDGKYVKLTRLLAEVAEDFSLVQFIPLAIEDKEAMEKVVRLIDKATGYVYTGKAGYDPYKMQVSSNDYNSVSNENVGNVEERLE